MMTLSNTYRTSSSAVGRDNEQERDPGNRLLSVA